MDIIETFDGTGPFFDLDGKIEGFDNRNWQFSTTEPTSQKLDGTFPLEAADTDASGEYESIMLEGTKWNGSFIQRVEVHDLHVKADHFNGAATVSFSHLFDEDRVGRDAISIDVSDPGGLTTWIDRASVVHSELSIGDNVAFELVFYDQLSLVELRYDDDIFDSTSPSELRIEEMSPAREVRRIGLFASAFNSARATARIDNFSLRSLKPGDLNYDFAFDNRDVEILSREIRSGENDRRYDLNDDRILDVEDAKVWIHDIFGSYFGDSNLDGEFNSSDLVSVFEYAEYEDSVLGNSTWVTGDWNLDGEFGSSDLVLAFQDGGYERGPRDGTTVPEPATPLIVLLATGVLFARRSPCRS
ncbi:MAG: PEP-CTERM sorting domain-containing protein [Planctomycetales bacterium]|nr:PEP-CTERM sorting domain-containing protein [Planctomycetales bacterium]